MHSNLAALDAVLADAGSIDEVWCLGDFVGYGPDPNEVLERLRALPLKAVAGNHDYGCVGKADVALFNQDARRACEWTSTVLTDDARSYLTALDAQGVFRDIYVAHGSPRDPVWEYITNIRTAQANFGYFGTSVCLVGHTHMPIVFRWRSGVSGVAAFVADVPEPGSDIFVGADRLIINPGSVGQPRDGVPLAAYAIYDPETKVFQFRRAAYDIGRTQARMREVGLPDRLSTRLQYGW